MRTSLESAAKEAGVKLQAGVDEHFALISHSKHNMSEEILKGEPFLFGQVKVNGKAGYYPIRVIEKDGKEVAQTLDREGKSTAEYPAQLSIPRLKDSPSPLHVIGGPGCFISITSGDMGATIVQFSCGSVSGTIIFR